MWSNTMGRSIPLSCLLVVLAIGTAVHAIEIETTLTHTTNADSPIAAPPKSVPPSSVSSPIGHLRDHVVTEATNLIPANAPTTPPPPTAGAPTIPTKLKIKINQKPPTTNTQSDTTTTTIKGKKKDDSKSKIKVKDTTVTTTVPTTKVKPKTIPSKPKSQPKHNTPISLATQPPRTTPTPTLATTIPVTTQVRTESTPSEPNAAAASSVDSKLIAALNSISSKVENDPTSVTPIQPPLVLLPPIDPKSVDQPTPTPSDVTPPTSPLQVEPPTTPTTTTTPTATTTAPITTSALPSVAVEPKPVPTDKLTKKPESVIAGGKIKPISSTKLKSDEVSNNTTRSTHRKKLKDKTQTPLSSGPISTNTTATTEGDIKHPSEVSTAPPAKNRPAPHVDLSHLEGDEKNVLLRSSATSWINFWSPMHGAILLILIFSISCLRRLIGVFRHAANDTTPPGQKTGLAAILSQLSSFNWEKKLGGGLESPMSNDHTRNLALLPFEDGKSRRRGARPAKTSGGATLASGGGDIEMQSLTASLASMHIPKMIYLPTPNDSSSSKDGVSSLAASCILTPQRLQLLLPYLPPTSHIQDIALKYSLSVCGASINDLYRRCSKTQDSITVIQDSAGYVFGCYVSSPWRVHDTYYGNADSFVFTLHPKFQVYPSTGSNSFYQLSTNDSIALGGGDHFAIWLDDSFRKGQSKSCQTFGSPSLSSEEEFRCHGQTHDHDATDNSQSH